MWGYVARRLLYNIPVFLGIVLFVMLALRTKDPVWAFLGKHGSQERHDEYEHKIGLDRPFYQQYFGFLFGGFGLREESWDQPGVEVGAMLRKAVMPSMAITVPALILSTVISICVGLISAYYRGRAPDRGLVFIAVLEMSVSFLVYIIFGQYFGAYLLNEKLGRELFAIEGYRGSESINYPIDWTHFCLLPVIISVIVSLGYDTRYYRAVMVEESNRDYITTARAKGATKRKIMFVHMLKNAMIPIVTRIMITLPFLITGSILLEKYFNIPGMGRTLIGAIVAQDFPVIQTFTAILAALFIVTNVLTDVIYAIVDPRVRLQ